MINLPVDFEERVRRPPVVGGAGYPYRISAKDLMDNFRALACIRGGEDFDHMWKASSAGESDAEVPVPLYNVLGGIVVVQGTRFEVEDVEELPCAAEGFICLKVIRESGSRALSEEEGEDPVIVFVENEEDIESTDTEEFTVLAELLEISTTEEDSGDPPIITQGLIQCRNDEICSHELMLVENGEFKLMPFQTNSRNSYDLPPEPEPEP